MKRLTWISSCISRLSEQNYKSAYLSFLRVGISIYVLKELWNNASGAAWLYSADSFLYRNDERLLAAFPGMMGILRAHYIELLIVCGVLALLNVAGIGKRITAALLFVSIVLVHKLNMQFVDGGGIMLRFILMYLIFADSYSNFVLIPSKPVSEDRRKLNNLLSNLAAFSIMLQLCVAYECSGIMKLQNELWRNGEAVYYALLVERFRGTPFNTLLVHIGWLMLSVNYGVLLFEIAFPFFIWISKCRKPLLIAGIVLHLSLYIFLMIYGFQVVFLLIYGLFLPNETWCKLIKKLPVLQRRPSKFT